MLCDISLSGTTWNCSQLTYFLAQVIKVMRFEAYILGLIFFLKNKTSLVIYISLSFNVN